MRSFGGCLVVVSSEGLVVRLRPMTSAEFEVWRNIAIRHHAEQITVVRHDSGLLVATPS
jgi:hypothetical protein